MSPMAWGSKPSTNLLTWWKETVQDLVPFQLMIAWPLASFTSKVSCDLALLLAAWRVALSAGVPRISTEQRMSSTNVASEAQTGGIASRARVWLARIGQGGLVLCPFSCLMVSCRPRVDATLSALKCVIRACAPPISGQSCSTSSTSTAQ